mgnify:CR=1 FL=1
MALGNYKAECLAENIVLCFEVINDIERPEYRFKQFSINPMDYAIYGNEVVFKIQEETDALKAKMIEFLYEKIKSNQIEIDRLEKQN